MITMNQIDELDYETKSKVLTALQLLHESNFVGFVEQTTVGAIIAGAGGHAAEVLAKEIMENRQMVSTIRVLDDLGKQQTERQ